VYLRTKIKFLEGENQMNKGIKTAATVLASTLTGAVAGATAVGKATGEKINKSQGYADKHLALFQMMTQWVKVKQEGKHLASYFEKNGYKKIAIYGMSYAGETLLNELKDTDIKVAYGIDQNAESLYVDVDVVTMDDDLEEVDAIVVTAITFFDEIEEKLSEKVDCPIISLEDVLYEV
jgi:dienelactone hydrolase